MNMFLAPGLIVVLSLAALPEITRIDSGTSRDVQIELAKSAAPREVSNHANIYVLGKKGYELAVKGTNGFSCLVERERPETMEPECYDAEGSRSTLLVRKFVEQERAAGTPEEVITAAVKAGYKSRRFKVPMKPGIIYMLSDSNYVFNTETKQVIHFPGHLMFYAPYATQDTVGSGKGAPYIVHPGEADALLIVIPGTN